MRRTAATRATSLIVTSMLALAALGAVATTATASSTPAQAAKAVEAAKTPSFASKLDTAVPQVMAENAIPGAILLVKSPQGTYRKTFGTGEIGKDVPLSQREFARIGSNTKTMTVTVILQLVQEGKLKLSDPISKFRTDVPNGDNITIAQLAEMRSGLYSYTFDPTFNAEIDANPQRAWTPDELLAIAFAHPNNFEPGTEFEYSNTNLVLLGVVIEQLTRLSARDAFAKYIFDPLKMTHTQLPKADDSLLPDPHPQGYQFGTNVETLDSYAVPADQLPAALDGTLLPLNYTDANPSWAWTAGGAISTVDDLAVYVKTMVGGGLLSKKLQRTRMDSIQAINPASPQVGYGLGIAKFATFYGHDGQLPGFSSMMVYDPRHKITVILFTTLSAVPSNGENAAVAVFRQAIVPSILGGSAASGSPTGATTATAG